MPGRDSTLGARFVRGRGLGSRVAVVVAAAVLVPNVLAGQNSDSNGVRLFEAGKYREAKGVFEPSLRANARDAAAAFYLGRIAMEERRPDRAADYFETAT